MIRALPLLILFETLYSSASAFSTRLFLLSRRSHPYLQFSLLQDNDDGDKPEESQMNQFIADFLKREKGPKPFTHMIAFPLDQCHEFMLQLESVQRAILYHCPILVHSCIASSMTRIPLLYVQANAGTEGMEDELTTLVEHVAKKHLFRPADIPIDVQLDDGGVSIQWQIPNADGIRPFGLAFQGLDIEGEGNEVLSCKVDPDHEDTQVLHALLDDLQMTIKQELGWDSELAYPSGAPKAPFMRLPSDWNEYLEKDPKTDLVTSDQGGNGISPIFWIKWENDVFGQARMPELAIYKNTGDTLDERGFYLPARSIELPDANAGMAKEEARFRDYQENRIMEAEVALDKDKNEEDEVVAEDDAMLTETKERLANVLEKSEGQYKAAFDIDMREEDAERKRAESEPGKKPSDAESRDDYTTERLRSIVASRERLRAETELSKPKNKPPIEENEVFRKYKEGTLAPNSRSASVQPELPPFPSPEHCTGFWRMLSSPTGFPVEEGDESRSDNLILRVDGTTAGGPIMDQETRQKASGGSWKLLGDSPKNTALKIKLEIPPKKERVLVMQGKLERASMKSETPLARSTFNIPALEELANREDLRLEDLLYCTGPVHIEDAMTGAFVEEIGTFSIMKLHTPSDPSQYVITIPKPIRNQD